MVALHLTLCGGVVGGAAAAGDAQGGEAVAKLASKLRAVVATHRDRHAKHTQNMLLEGGSDGRSGFTLQGYQNSKFTERIDHSEDVARASLLTRQVHQQINHPFKPRPWRRWDKVPAPPPCTTVGRTLQLAGKTGCHILFTRTF